MSESPNPLPQSGPDVRPLRWMPLVVMLAIVIVAALRPGDAPWLQDEPMLFNTAIEANSTPANIGSVSMPFTLAGVGLRGTRGVFYGPVPTWIYQLLLLFSHNLLAIIVVKSMLVNLATGLSLYWLARNLRISPWLAVITMLSPWLLFYSRELWDNNFCIPFSAVLLASYADFIVRHRTWTLYLAFFCISLLVLTHFMCLVTVAAVLFHLIVFQRKKVRRVGWIGAIGILVVVNLLAWPYWLWLTQDRTDKFIGELAPVLNGALFPFLGAHHLTATDFGNILNRPDTTNEWFMYLGSLWPIVSSARWLTSWLYPMTWIGIVIAAVQTGRVLKKRRELGLWEQLGIVCLLTLAGQCVMDGYEGVNGPHYFNATWIIFVFFIWQALDARWLKSRKWLITTLLTMQIIGCIVVSTGIVAFVMQNGGARTANYGTSIGLQIEAVREKQQFDPASPVESHFSQWNAYPDAAQVIQKLNPAPPGEKPYRHVLIYYRNQGPFDAHIVVEGAPVETKRLASGN